MVQQIFTICSHYDQRCKRLYMVTETYPNKKQVANPHKDDKYFSRMRSFDLFHGHSWAKGLFESADGKDQESSSEDMHFGLSMKLWGQVSHDGAMEGRANLMMAQMRRSFNEYFYVMTGNNTHPPEFSRNKGGGIVSTPFSSSMR